MFTVCVSTFEIFSVCIVCTQCIDVAVATVCVSVGPSFNPYKMVELIEVTFGICTPVDPRNYVLGGGPSVPSVF